MALLTKIRAQLINGDYRALYAVWEKYGLSTADSSPFNTPPVPKTRDLKDSGQSIIELFRDMLVLP